jgi:hypothetical protein
MTRKYTTGVMTQQAVAQRIGISVRRVVAATETTQRKIRQSIERRAKRAKLTVWEWLFENEGK